MAACGPRGINALTKIDPTGCHRKHVRIFLYGIEVLAYIDDLNAFIVKLLARYS